MSVAVSRFRVWLALLILAGSVVALPAVAAKKALVIGSDHYDHLGNLNNAVNDAQDLFRRLSELGFKTRIVTDGDRRAMSRALSQFADTLSPDDTALFFFAGHGIHARGQNYLIPTDARAIDEDDLEADALTAEHVLKRISDAGPKLTIMLLDACRNNPLKNRTRSVERGLGLIQLPGGARGTLVGYAAGIGEAAMDSDARQRNGLYTGALLTALREPGLTIEQVMKRVRADVSGFSNGRQNPWTLASIEGDFIPNDTDLTVKTTMPADMPQQAVEVTPYPGQAPGAKKAGKDYPVHAGLDSMLDEITGKKPPTQKTPPSTSKGKHLQKKSGGSLEDFMQDLISNE